MHGLIADGAGGAWTFGSSILTFAFPMILFIAVAGALYVLYTKPEFVPGHRAPGLERPVSYTPVPGPPAIIRAAANKAPADNTPANNEPASNEPATPATESGGAAQTEDGE